MSYFHKWHDCLRYIDPEMDHVWSVSSESSSTGEQLFIFNSDRALEHGTVRVERLARCATLPDNWQLIV